MCVWEGRAAHIADLKMHAKKSSYVIIDLVYVHLYHDFTNEAFSFYTNKANVNEKHVSDQKFSTIYMREGGLHYPLSHYLS